MRLFFGGCYILNQCKESLYLHSIHTSMTFLTNWCGQNFYWICSSSNLSPIQHLLFVSCLSKCRTSNAGRTFALMDKIKFSIPVELIFCQSIYFKLSSFQRTQQQWLTLILLWSVVRLVSEAWRDGFSTSPVQPQVWSPTLESYQHFHCKIASP